MTSNLVQRHVLWTYTPYQSLGQIDRNLHNRVFDDVICKQLIDWDYLDWCRDKNDFVNVGIDEHEL